MATYKSTKSVIVANVEILQDEFGRYNLNLLHQASESPRGKLPSQWVRRKTTHELIEALQTQNVNLHSEVLVILNGGRSPGVYAHELLAISYAGWISPQFQLLVNQAFADWKHGRLIPRPTDSPHLGDARYEERTHISEHLIAVWLTLRQAISPLSNWDIQHLAHLKEGTVRKHTRYLLRQGLLDLHETRPRHLFTISRQAEKRHAAAWQRLELTAEIFAQHQSYWLSTLQER